MCFLTHCPCSFTRRRGFESLSATSSVHLQSLHVSRSRGVLKPLLIWGWLSVKDIYLIHFVKNINSAVFHDERLMHICTQDEKTWSTFRSVMFHCWDLDGMVHDIKMTCDWFTDTIIKALKMIINLFFFSSFPPASLILLSVLVRME